MERQKTTDLQYCLYGDPDYAIRAFLIVTYSRTVENLTQQQRRSQTSISRVRTILKWRFMNIIKYFTYVNFNKKVTIAQVLVAKVFAVLAILWNFRVCLYGSQGAELFDI